MAGKWNYDSIKHEVLEWKEEIWDYADFSYPTCLNLRFLGRETELDGTNLAPLSRSGKGHFEMA